MARKFVFRMESEGDEEVKRKLAAVGAEGTAAFQKIGQSATQLDSPLTKAEASADRVRKRLVELGAEPPRALHAVGAAAGAVEGEMRGLAGRLGPVGAGLAALGPAGLVAAAGIGALTLGLGAAIREAAEAEKVSLRLEAVLKATGNTTGLTAKQIDEFAGGLQAATGTSDEAIKEMAAQLATFRSVSGDTFKRTIAAALDMGAVFGDAGSAMLTLAKAAEDPIQGLAGLRRMGVALNETQRESIRVMAEAGDTAGAYAVILGEVERKTGGTAARQGEGLTGATEKLRAAWHNLLEEIGQTPVVFQMATDAVNALRRLAEFGTDLVKGPSLRDQLAELKSRGAELLVKAGEKGAGAFFNLSRIVEDPAALQAQIQLLEIQIEDEEKLQRLVGQRGDVVRFAAEKDDAAAREAEQQREENERREKERQARFKKAREELWQFEIAAAVEYDRGREDAHSRALKIIAEDEQARERADAKAEAEREKIGDKAAEERRRLAEREAELMLQPFKNAVSGIQAAFADGFENILSGGVNTFGDLAETVRRIFIRLAAEIAALLVFRPQLAGAGLSGIFGSIGIGGSGSAGGFGGIGSALNAFGASTGIFASGISATVASAGPGAIGPHVVGSVPGAATGLFGSTATLSTVLGAAGIGAFGGSILGPLLGLNGTGATIGGGAGAGIGALIGGISAVGLPVIGPIVGGLLGGVLGGLFGGGKTKTPQAETNLVAGPGGLLTVGGDIVRAGGNFGATQAGAASVADIVNQILGSLGGGLAPGAAGGRVLTSTGKNQGTVFIGGVGGRDAGTFKSMEEAVNAVALGILREAARGGALQGVGATAAAVLAGSKATDIAGLGLDLEFARLYDALTKVVPATSAAEQAIAALEAQFAAAKDRAAEFGLGLAELDAGLARAKNTLKTDFVRAIDDAILAFTDPLRAQLATLARVAEQRLADAKTFGADLVAVERLNALERGRAIEQANAAALAATRAATANLRQFIDQLTLGPLSTLDPEARLFEAKRQYEAALATGRAGGAEGIAAFPGAAQAYLGVARETFASSEPFARIFGQVLDAARGLAGFQHGGEFTVPGAGGSDSKVVAIRATPGERVRVTPPGGGNEMLTARQLNDIHRALGEVAELLRRIEGETRMGRIQRSIA